MNTDGQVLFNQSATAGTHFCRVAWINLYKIATSILRFVRNELYELSPGSIRNAFVHTPPVAIHHVLNVQLFKGNYAKVVYQSAAEFMRKVSTLVGNTLVNMRYHPPLFRSLRRALLGFAQSSLRLCQCLFLFTEKPWISNLLAIRAGSKTGKPYIYSDCQIHLWQWIWFNDTRKASIPIAQSITADNQCFDCSANRSVKLDLHLSNLGQMEFAIFKKFESALRISKTIVTLLSTKTRITRFLPFLYATKESLECKVYSCARFLQTLRVSIVQKAMFLFPSRYHFNGTVARYRALFLFPGIFSYCKSLVVNPTTSVKRLLQSRSLYSSWIDSVLISLFMHNTIVSTSNIKGNSSPPQGMGFSCQEIHK